MSLMRSAPLIGITPGHAGPSDLREFCKTADIIYCDLSYVRCIESAGGTPLLLTSLGDQGVNDLIEAVDGLLLTGGEDVHPGRYEQEVIYHNGTISETRDDSEIRLVKAFFGKGKPILAVCRGIQVLNVALGGTLFQDLPLQVAQFHHAQRAATTIPTHRVRLKEGSRIARAIGAIELEVNSHHHQAVDRIAGNLTAVGWSEEGLVEAVEHSGLPYVVGVQWHPERLAAAQNIQNRIFADFAQACRQRP